MGRHWFATTSGRYGLSRYGLAAAMGVISVCGSAVADDVLVSDQAAFREAVLRAAPGDRIVLADGEWRDFEAVIGADGTADAPITLMAETPGGVRLTGRSNLSIGGDHLIISGLTFTEGHSPTDAVIAFSVGDDAANHVRLTETVIEGFNKPKRNDQDSWVVLHGRANTVDHSAFLGKTNKGPTLIVRLDAEAEARNEHVIEANYFGPRPPLGGNGGETLRIGVSQTSDVDAGTVVRGNLFERASGEVEIISIKAEGNLVTENTFFESSGSVVFRHGGDNEVSRNVFLGNGVADTGGIRVINDAQTVRDNYLEGLRGRKFLGALVVMNGVPNSPQNRYHQVTDAVITANSFIDIAHMGFGVGTDGERSAVPKDSAVKANLIVPTEGADLGLFDDMSGVDFSGNVATRDVFSPIAETIVPDLSLTRADNGLLYPEDDDLGAPRDLTIVDRDTVGPDHYEKPPLAIAGGETSRVTPDADALRSAIAAASPGDVLIVAAGDVTVSEPIVVDKPLTIVGAEDGATVLVAERGLFSLVAGAQLTLTKVALVQDSAATPLIHARGDEYRGDYRLTLSNIEATASVPEAAPLVAADPETFASLITVEALGVRDWPGAVFALSGEGLDGYYLAEDVRISDSAFENVGGPVISYGREGRDESTFGPRFAMTGTTLRRVRPGAAALELNGVDGLAIDRNTFSGSGDVIVRRRVLGLPFSIGTNTVEGGTKLDMIGVEGEPMDGSLTAGVSEDAVGGPSLVLTADGADAIRATGDLPPLLRTAFTTAKDRVTRSAGEGVIVPLPADPGGGYTHERHKENYKVIHDAGILFALTGKDAYKDHAEAMLLGYAAIYDDLPLHPQAKEQTPGRLFWQSLNESVWLVHAIQGYDAIRADLSEDARATIEGGVLRPMAEFLSTGQPQTFDKIHNHGTWAAAAVGMTGYALGEQALVDRALMGLDGTGKSGFLAQMDQLFSPDGYYTEGPYYQRYALMPFVLFGQSIDHNEPDRAIFERRDGILMKAITATIQQSYGGKFFAINDAIKEKGLDTQELVYGVAAAYGKTGDPGLLSIARTQGATVLTGDGLALATAAADGKAEAFSFETQVLRDGPDGDQGGLAILRMGEGEDAQTAVLKHTGQGLGHGHFDKLALTFYDGGREVVTDYGAARFLNVPSKAGGRYLPENQSFAKQTVAHNTVVVGGESHFGGDWKRGQESWPEITAFEAGEQVQIIQATIDDAYDDATLTRTTVQVARDGSAPILIDLFDVEADTPTQIDLPLYFNGQLTDTDLDLARPSDLSALGEAAGYQHLWLEARAAAKDQAARFTWLSGDRFYTYHTTTSEPSEAMIVRTGATDPDFNLRSHQGIIMRMPEAADGRFVSVIEPHGLYDPAQEVTVQSGSEIEAVTHERGRSGSVVRVAFSDGTAMTVGVADDPSKRRHRVRMNGRTYAWSGPVRVFEEQKR